MEKSDIRDYELGKEIDFIDPPYVVLRAVTVETFNGETIEGSVQCTNQGGFFDGCIWDTFEKD